MTDANREPETEPTPGALMRAEIAEQPARWREMAERGEEFAELAAYLRERKPSGLVFVARGTSDHAALYGQYLIQRWCKLPVSLATPSVDAAAEQSLYPSSTAMVGLSQSGRSPDIVATLDLATRSGLATVSMTNNPSSELAAAAERHLPLAAGPELAVAATKSYTLELLALYRLAAALRGDEPDAVRSRLLRLADAADRYLSALADDASGLSAAVSAADRMVLGGRGIGYSTAKEGALKIMETNGIAASGWSTADLRHGPLGQVQADTPVVLMAGTGAERDSVLETLALVRERTELVWVIGAAVDAQPQAMALPGADLSSDVESDLDPALHPALEILPLQLAALEGALHRGLDPDRPRGLSKVTLTR